MATAKPGRLEDVSKRSDRVSEVDALYVLSADVPDETRCAGSKVTIQDHGGIRKGLRAENNDRDIMGCTVGHVKLKPQQPHSLQVERTLDPNRRFLTGSHQVQVSAVGGI
eukprot:3358712-Pyramimonas_sp.AAC.2